MSQFEYVAVLTSIIVGLALTQLLRGVGQMVTVKDGPRPYWVHLVWTLYLFIFTTLFWWWEYNFIKINWNISVYYLWIIYATLFFFTSIVLQPQRLIGVSSYKEYFYRNRRWFFGLMITFTLWDVVDTLAKGASHFAVFGNAYWVIAAGTITGSAIAMITKNERYHQAFAVIWLLQLIVRNFQVFFILA